MTRQEDQTYRYGEETDAEGLLLSLSAIYGIRPQVENLMSEVGDMRPKGAHPSLPSLLKRVREHRKYPISEISKRSNLSKSQIRFYEGGQQKNPGIRTIQALSYGYRIPFSVILLAAMQGIHPRATIRRRIRNDPKD